MEQTSTFIVKVEDQGDGALSVADKLEQLANNIRGSEAEVAGMQRALRNLRDGGAGAAESVAHLKNEIALHKAAIASSQAEYIKLGGTFANNISKSKQEQAQRQAELASRQAAAEQARGEAQAAREAARAASELAREQERAAEAAAKAATAEATASAKAAMLAADERAAAMQARDFRAALDSLSGAKIPELNETIRRDTAEIARLEIAIRRLGPATEQTGAQIAGLKARLQQQRTGLDAAKLKLQELGGVEVKPDVSGIKGVADAVSKIPGPIGQAGNNVKKFADLLKGGFAVGCVMAVAAAAALVVGLGALAIAWFKFGVASSSARREQDLTLQSLVASRRVYQDVTTGVAGLNDVIAQTAQATGASRAMTSKYVQSLYEAGLRGEQLQTAVKGASIVALAMGEQHAQTFTKNAAAMKGNQDALLKYTGLIETRLGGIATKRAQSFTNQVVRLKENVTGLFSGLKLDRFLGALTKITNMFSEQSATGAALKQIFESLFQPMVDGAANSVPLVKRLIQGLVIAALHVAILFVKVRNSILDAFEGSSIAKIDKMKLALDTGKVVMYTFVAAVGVAAAVVGTLGAAIYIAIQPLILLKDFITSAVEKVSTLVSAFTNADVSIRDMDWGSLGTSIVMGIVGGLTPGPIGDKMSQIGQEAWKSFKDSVKIGSPSKLFRVQGGQNIARSVSMGADDERPKVRRSMARLVEPPRPAEVRVQARAAVRQGLRAPAAEASPLRPQPPAALARPRRAAPPRRPVRFGAALNARPERQRPAPRAEQPAFRASLDVGAFAGLFAGPAARPPVPPRSPVPRVQSPPTSPTIDAPPTPTGAGAPPPRGRDDDRRSADGGTTINVGGVSITIKADSNDTAKKLAAEVEPEFSSMLRDVCARIGA